MLSIEDMMTKARNIYKKLKNDHAASMSYLRRILKSRLKNKEAKAAFQSELRKTMKLPEGVEENASKKRAANSPPDDLIGRARKLSIGENRRAIIRKERLNSAPTTTSQRDRTPRSRRGKEKARKKILSHIANACDASMPRRPSTYQPTGGARSWRD